MLEQWSPIILKLLRGAAALFNADILRLFGHLHLPFGFDHPGPYDVLEHRVRLELKDDEGKKAIYYKDQKVRFLQDNVIAYQDKAWGVGNIFAEYKCSPGVVVDRYREGHRYLVLISLRETKKRGDLAAFHIERTIMNGFSRPAEDLQTDIDHRTDYLSIAVVFPHQRPPKDATLIEQNATRSTTLDNRHRQVLADGRLQIIWETRRPRLYESYIIAWHW
jgi:hypothetical protein